MKYKAVKIKWRDSNRIFEQINFDEDMFIAEIETVGWLVYEDGDRIVLSQDLIDKDFRGVIIIPKENIIDIKKL